MNEHVAQPMAAILDNFTAGMTEGRVNGLRMGKIHAARLDKSDRLQCLRGYLSDGEWHGTREIVEGAQVMAVNSAVTELRANGLNIETRCVGRGRHEYRMTTGFHFATRDRARALAFIQKVYPSKVITDTPECAGPLLDLVEADIVRVQDPLMHGANIEVIPATNWKEEHRADVVAACKLFA